MPLRVKVFLDFMESRFSSVSSKRYGDIAERFGVVIPDGAA